MSTSPPVTPDERTGSRPLKLYELLIERREEILAICRGKVTDSMGSRLTAEQTDWALPVLYEELIAVLKVSLDGDSSQDRQRFVADLVSPGASRQYAQESYRLGYTVSQVVHGYGAICQGITDYAHEVKAPITTAEFGQLNLCLDVAIAQAVSEFEVQKSEHDYRAESLRLGNLVHELRNALSNAMVAYELIRVGGVGVAGSTSSILTMSHERMKTIIDRAVAEVRMQGSPTLELGTLQLLSLLSEVESTALPGANAKSLAMHVNADPELYVAADRHLLGSAISNLVNNAVKFTPQGESIWIRAYAEGAEAVIEVEDRCGGISQSTLEDIFQPYVQKGSDKTGLGLGLSIARRAAELNNGHLKAQTLPGRGCIFTIRIPLYVPDVRPPLLP